jgi:hypothetical protein
MCHVVRPCVWVMYLADLEQFISRTQGDAVQQRLKVLGFRV